MKDTLTLEHLAPYLAQGVDFLVTQDVEYAGRFRLFGLDAEVIEVVGSRTWRSGKKLVESFTLEDITLVLLPMSALTEPLEDGTIPIVELAKIANPGLNWRLSVDRAISDGFNFGIDSGSFWLYDYIYDRNLTIFNQLSLFQYLFKHHFDPLDLIGKGLAIDKRTIKTESK